MSQHEGSWNAVVRSRLTDYYAALNRFDVEAVASAFTRGGTCEDPIGAPVLRGRDELRRAIWSRARAFARSARAPLDVSVVTGGAAVHWRADVVELDGNSASFTGIDVFELAEDGAIVTVRSYWDPASVGRARVEPRS